MAQDTEPSELYPDRIENSPWVLIGLTSLVNGWLVTPPTAQ